MPTAAHSGARYEVRPRKDKRGVDLISDVLPFGRLWYTKPDHAIGYAMHNSRSHDAVIRVYVAAGNVIETHEHAGDFVERERRARIAPAAPMSGVESRSEFARTERSHVNSVFLQHTEVDHAVAGLGERN